MANVLRRFKADVFQALGHPTRIAIVELLRDGPLSAGKLIEQLGIEQANASQHLSVLRSRQIVINRKQGNQVFYSLRDPMLSPCAVMMMTAVSEPPSRALRSTSRPSIPGIRISSRAASGSSWSKGESG